MKIRVTKQIDGDIQFVVESESDADIVVLNLFARQTREKLFHLHGFTSEYDGIHRTSFNFGTITP